MALPRQLEETSKELCPMVELLDGEDEDRLRKKVARFLKDAWNASLVDDCVKSVERALSDYQV